MKAIRALSVLCLSVLPVQLWAQTPNTTSAAAIDATTVKAVSTDDLKQLRERIARQEDEIKKLQESVEEQRTMLEKAVNQTVPQVAAAANMPSTNTAGSGPVSAQIVPVINVARPHVLMQKAETASPLGISIGNTTLTPLGFMDATFFARSTNVGSGIGSNFAGLPFNNVAGGHLSESNFSAQNSRIGFRIDSTVMGWKVLGYLEADFLFNNNSNSFQVTSNSAGFRLRNYFVDTQKGKFEFLAGQDWSFLTPNRKGVSPIPSDIFYTQNMDTNYQAGLIWTRQPQFRFIVHPNDNVAFGVSLENPQQYIGGGGGAGAVTLPGGLSTALASQLNAGSSISGVPNQYPDVIAKLALDGHPGGKAMHFEVSGLVRGFKDYVLPSLAANGIVAGSHSATGGGGSINSNIEIVKNVRLVENAFFSDGGGRYIFGMAPDFIVRPNGNLSPVHSSSTVDGIEAQVSKNTLLAAYYGGTWIGKNVAFDTTGAKPGLVGYGFTGSGSNNNRNVQEITFDWVQTLWKNKNYGALALINQYSYVLREPWYVSPNSPDKGHTNIVYVNLRYTLP